MQHSQDLLRQAIIPVNTDDALASCCADWLGKALLAIDTEFIRVDTYYPIAALIQVNDGAANYLIDPLKINNWQPLAAVLTSPDVVKAFHACSEDLDVFKVLLGVLPVRLFDTQVAAAFLAIGVGVGYGNLVNKCLGVDLPKGETRSDWLERPLSDAQILYAALDVDYLFELAEGLKRQLDDCARTAWAFEESAAIIENFRNNNELASGFYKSNNTWQLTESDLVIAKAMFEWREGTARQKNIPRTRIFKDAQLFELIARKPNALPQLKTLGLHDSAIRKFGREILSLLSQESDAQDAQDAQIKASQRPLTKPQRERVKELKTTVNKIAAEQKISPEIIARKTDYFDLVRSELGDIDHLQALKASATGWRKLFFEQL